MLLPLDASRLCVCKWLLALPGGEPRSSFRTREIPGILLPACRFSLFAARRDFAFRVHESFIRGAKLGTLLFW